MKVNKNNFLSIVVGLMAISFCSAAVSQVNYPVRPIKLIVVTRLAVQRILLPEYSLSD